MQRLEVRGVVRLIYRSLGVEGLILVLWQNVVLCKSYAAESTPECLCHVLCSLSLNMLSQHQN